MESTFPDLTFVIPFYYDGEYRLENLQCILKILGKFGSNVIVIEQGGYQHFTNTDFYFDEAKINGKYYFIPNHDVCQGLGIELFYRTKIINIGLKKVATKYASIYDTDVFFDDENYRKTYDLLLGKRTVVYPYDGRFVDIDRSYITDGIIKQQTSMATGSYGGAVFLNLDDYRKCGLENEKLIGWAPEDFERHSRIDKLGFNIHRIEGKCYHIIHPHSGINSSPSNPFDKQNLSEYCKVNKMEKEQLIEYIKTFSWALNSN